MNGKREKKQEDKVRIGIIAAVESEINTLKAELKNPEVKTIAGFEFYSGTLGNYDVIFVMCGVGKVSAAVCTQIMISEYHPDCIINTGSAGAVSDELEVGDIVLAQQTAEWDLDVSFLGYPAGRALAYRKERNDANEEMNKLIETAIGESAHVVKGLIVSSDQFVYTKEQREKILMAFPDALCTEMEGAAIGYVCARNGVPFCVMRCISDNANHDSVVDYREFADKVGEKAALMLKKLFRNH